MTKAQRQAREYAAEADNTPITDVQRAAIIAEKLRRIGCPRGAAYVVSWQDQAARLHAAMLRHNDAMAELLEKYYALRDKPRPFDREGKPPPESSD